MTHNHVEDPACEVAHGASPAEDDGRTLVAVFVSPVAEHLLRFGDELGFRTVLFDPDPARHSGGRPAVTRLDDVIDATCDVVLTDHHREEIGPVLRDLLKSPARWIGIMGSPRHEGPHVRALTELGVAPEEIARVHRPIGLNIGSRTPAEIALATVAGLIADRNGRPGGFAF
ncbi:XdhC family protein [Nonomuraea sp. NPDC049309]|uniref:XdhC family protein n=1 Tax=Nonomuraea sp. NPDC049309 TaxID=3364350 RepID=UPI00371F52EB